MRVGLVVPGFSADNGDWCIPALRHLARGVAAAGDDLQVVAVRYPYRSARYRVDCVEVSAVGGGARRGSGTLGVWAKTLDVLRTAHSQRPFDVLHAFWATESGLLTAIAGKLLRIPTLVSLAGGELVAIPDIAYGDQRIAWERLKVRASLRLASAVTAGSRHLLDLAAHHIPRHRLHRTPLGVDLNLFTPGPPSGNGTRIVHVGTLTGVKDQRTLLNAFGLVREHVPDASLTIAGDGPLRPQLEHQLGELQLTQAVTFQGSLDHARLPGVYRQGDVFVVSSRHEAQSMVAVEAAACGLPVVGTCVGVIPELADDDGVVPVRDATALATALVNAVAAPPRRLSADHLEAEFGLAQCVARFRGLYAELIAR
jgi:glycosyltransferase involved in cell wall biosynthesis